MQGNFLRTQPNRVQDTAARFMEDIGVLCDRRFAILCSEPGGEELVSFRYAIAHNASDENEGEVNARIR